MKVGNRPSEGPGDRAVFVGQGKDVFREGHRSVSVELRESYHETGAGRRTPPPRISPDPGQALRFGVAPVLMPRTLPTHERGVKVGEFGSGQTIAIHGATQRILTVRVELRATLNDIAGDPHGLAGLEVGCLRVECHRSVVVN